MMSEALGAEPGDRVLEIGTGLGYQAAILAELVDQVFSVEIVEELGLQAAERLGEAGYVSTGLAANRAFLGRKWGLARGFDAWHVHSLEPGNPELPYHQGDRMVDLARPKQNTKTTGFTPSERRELTRWLSSGWVDTFRSFHPRAPGHYTWWSPRSQCRERNIGWRIDYVLANAAAARRVQDAFIWPHVQGSDHCPVGVDLRLA